MFKDILKIALGILFGFIAITAVVACCVLTLIGGIAWFSSSEGQTSAPLSTLVSKMPPKSELTQTYIDRESGFAVSNPSDWYNIVSNPGSLAIFQSFPLQQNGRSGIPAGELKIDIYISENAGETFKERSDEVREKDDVIVLWEQACELGDGMPAWRMQIRNNFGESALVLTTISDYDISVCGMGDLGQFDDIVTTFRPFP
jgi:hypothetical protein